MGNGERRGRSARPADLVVSPAGPQLFLETLLSLAGWIKLDLAVISVCGRPLGLY